MMHVIPKSLKSGIILPLLKGKGAKANNKDNYIGITLFPTLSFSSNVEDNSCIYTRNLATSLKVSVVLKF